MRTIVASRCDALVDAAALIVALTVDPLAVTRSIPPIVQPRKSDTSAEAPDLAPPLPDPIPPAAIPPATIQPEPNPSPAASSSPGTSAGPSRLHLDAELTAGVLGGIELGAGPGISASPHVAFGVLFPRLRVELGGWYASPRTATNGDASVRVQMGAAVVRACARLRAGRVEFPLCGGVDIGASHGEGVGVPDARGVNGLWIAPSLSPGVHGWIWPRLAIVGRLEAAFPVTKTAFEARDPGDPLDLFEPSAISGRFWIGVEGKLRPRRDG